MIDVNRTLGDRGPEIQIDCTPDSEIDFRDLLLGCDIVFSDPQYANRQPTHESGKTPHGSFYIIIFPEVDIRFLQTAGFQNRPPILAAAA